MLDGQPENKPNPNPNTNPNTNPPGPDYHDWREQRREWRNERREHREHDPLRGLFWGLILIMVGILFFIKVQSGINWDTLWKYLLIGLGAIFIIDGLAHYWNPEYRYISYGRFVPGVILIFVGLAFIYGFDQWWPLVLIAVGVIVLISVFFRRR
jgi:hypothetical protein